MKNIKGGIISKEVLEQVCNNWWLNSGQIDPNLSTEAREIVLNLAAEVIASECEEWVYGRLS